MVGLKAAVSAALLLAITAGVMAQDSKPTTIVRAGDNLFTIEVAPNWCQQHVVATARADDEDTYTAHASIRRRMLAGMQAAMQESCPQADMLTINGFVDDIFLYRILATREAGGDVWRGIEIPVELVDDLPDPPQPNLTQVSSVPMPRAESVAECDRAASHPDDPMRPKDIPGVRDDDMHAGRALAACEEAVLYDLDNSRLLYQLARAYLMYDRPVDGVEMLTEAAEEGSGPATAALGDIALYGLLGGEPNPVLARALYAQAAERGFEPAGALSKAIEESPEEDTERSVSGEPSYQQPHIMEAILQGSLPEQADADFFYMYSYGRYLLAGVLNFCPNLAKANPMKQVALLESRTREAPADVQAAVETIMGDTTLRDSGRDDGYALAFHKGCQSTEVAAVRNTFRDILD